MFPELGVCCCDVRQPRWWQLLMGKDLDFGSYCRRPRQGLFPVMPIVAGATVTSISCRGNQGTERQSNLPKVTQLADGKPVVLLAAGTLALAWRRQPSWAPEAALLEEVCAGTYQSVLKSRFCCQLAHWLFRTHTSVFFLAFSFVRCNMSIFNFFFPGSWRWQSTVLVTTGFGIRQACLQPPFHTLLLCGLG